MRKARVSRKVFIYMVILILICLTISVFGLMQYVKNMLSRDAKVNLTEIVTQNKNVINSKLKVETNNLEVYSNSVTEYLSERHPENEEAVRSLIGQFGLTNGDAFVSVADNKGNGTFAGGMEINVAGRSYYKYAMDGRQNISDKVLSRLDGAEVFIICVPVYLEERVVGTVQRAYTEEEMNEICALSLFSEQGYMCIINSDGYVVLHTPGRQLFLNSDNYYRDIYETGNKEAAMKLEDGIKQGKSGFMETELNGQRIFSAYTPIEDIHDWYLVTSVPTGVVTANGDMIITLFYAILLIVVAVFAVCLFYFAGYKNRQKKNIETIAFVDEVTGGDTYNKFLVDVPDILVSRFDKHFYIVKIDINNFKYINNYYGYSFGDSVLKKVYSHIKRMLGADERIARQSADNFVLLLEVVAGERMNELLYGIEYEEEVSIYFSVGVYSVEDKEESLSLMVDKAGTAARAMKGEMNRKLVFYSDYFDKMNVYNEQLKRAVKKAIDARDFFPIYQPKVNIHTGEVVGAEALARWRTKDGTAVSPDIFIPMSESTGLVADIDMIILDQVLAYLKKAMDKGIPCIPISVNFSRLHLRDSAFLDKLSFKLQQYHVPPHLLEVELTESAIFDNMSSIYEFTENLRKMGLSLAMDDFGSGYSSLNMLRQIPIDVLKIDKGFLSGMRNAEDGDRRDIIFSSIVQMVHKLHILVVVEGVETAENVELMKNCGCAVAQGFYYSKPLNEDAFDKIFMEKTIC